jgi:MoaA/NifB/PqqE/SkfB family radical SAM enzyme
MPNLLRKLRTAYRVANTSGLLGAWKLVRYRAKRRLIPLAERWHWLGRKLLVSGLLHEPYVQRFMFDATGATAVPSDALLDLTYQCNLSCRMCPQAVDRSAEESTINANRRKLKPLDLSDWKTVARKLREAGIRRVTLTGGELFVLRYAADLIHYIRTLDVEVGILTNGTLITPDLAEFLVRERVESVSISIDGPREVHNAIRGRADAYDGAIHGLQLLIAARSRAGGVPRVGLAFTLSALNYDALDRLPSMAAQYGVGLTVGMLQFFSKEPPQESFSAATKGENRNLPPSIRDVNPRRLAAVLKSARREIARLGIAFTTHPPSLSDREIIQWYTRPGYRYTRKCLAPWRLLNIDPYGRLVMCMIGECTGNLLDQSVEEALNTQDYRTFRQSLRRVGVFTWCTHCCMLSCRAWGYLPTPRRSIGGTAGQGESVTGHA